MKKIENSGQTCCKKIVDKQYKAFFGHTESWVCGKPATYTNGQHFFCRHHSKMGRYVIREGEKGNILSRFDTEEEVRAEFSKIDNKGLQIQRITKSKVRVLQCLIIKKVYRH